MPTINGNAGYRGRSARSRLVVDARARDTQTNRSDGAYAPAGRSAGSAQGPGGISAHVANSFRTYGRVGGGAGACLVNEQGVSVYMMSLISGREPPPAPFWSRGMDAGPTTESRRQYDELTAARRDIARDAITSVLDHNPELTPRSGLMWKSWLSPRRNAQMAEGRNMSGAPPIAHHVIVVEHPALQGGKALLGPRFQKYDKDEERWPAIIVDQLFLDALSARGARLEDSDQQLVTSGQFNGAQIDLPRSNAFILKDGRRAQQFGSAVVVLDKKAGEPAQIWKHERLVEEGLLDADKVPPPLYPVGTFGRPAGGGRSPASTLIAERARASTPTIDEVEVSDAERATWLPPSTFGDGAGPLVNDAREVCDAFRDAVRRGKGRRSGLLGHQLIPLQRGRTFATGAWIGRRFDALLMPKDPRSLPGGDRFHAGYDDLQRRGSGLEELLPSEGTVLALHHPVHGNRTLHGAAAEAFISRPEALKGWSVGELLGAPTGDWSKNKKLGARPFDKGVFTFEHGTLTNARQGVEIAWNCDVEDLVGGGKRLPSTKKAARELLKHFTSALGASDQRSVADTIDLADLITVSVDPARPTSLRRAAEAMVSEVATGLAGLTPDTSLTRAHLETLAA